MAQPGSVPWWSDESPAAVWWWLADVVRVAVHLPVQRGVQVEVAVAEEDALGGVHPAGVAVRLLLLHRPDPSIQERVQVRRLVAALRRRLRLPQRALADAAEAGRVVPVAVHDDRVVI